MESPLIQNGQLTLDTHGQLTSAPDIQTQMNVTVGAYNCIYDANLNSFLVTYLADIPQGGFSSTTITNIVVAAYTSTMIAQKLISNLQVSVRQDTISYVTINIKAIDAEGNPLSLSWTNLQ